MKAVILAAGYATRLYPLTENMPKALLTLDGKTLLDYTIDAIVDLNNRSHKTVVDEIVIVSNNKFYNQFCDWAKNNNCTIKLTILNDGTNSNADRRGAIGCIQFAIESAKIDDELMVLVSDNYFTYDLKDYYDFYVAKQADCILGRVFTEDESKYLAENFAVAVLDNHGRVIDLQEKPGVGNAKSNIGVYATYIYTKQTVPLIKKYLDEGNNKDAPGNFPSWLYRKKPVYFYAFNGKCYDIGTIEVYNKLNAELTNKNNK